MFTQLKSKYFISVKKEIFYSTTCISIPWYGLILMNYFYFLHWHYYFKIFKGGILQCEILKVKQSGTCISFYLRFIWEVKNREFSIWDKWALMLYNMNHFHSSCRKCYRKYRKRPRSTCKNYFVGQGNA